VSGYLLDGTALVEPLRSSPSPAFVRRLMAVPTADRWTSATTVGEVFYLARRWADPALMADLLRLVSSIRVAAFDVAAANNYAKLAASLEWAKIPLSSADTMTVAIAKTLDLTLVTRRGLLFKGVSQLRIEDWTAGLPAGAPG
jgi:predicted nucleic acid-binding protein